MKTPLQNKKWVLLAMGISLSLSPAYLQNNAYAGSATTVDAQAPPTGVLNPRIASGDAKVTLTWDMLTGTGIRYNVLRSTTQSGTYTTIATNLDATRYVDATVTNGNTYYYKMVATNADGSSPETAVMMATPVATRHLYLNFDETTGMVAADRWGGYHAALQPTATRAASQAGQALKLDGGATSFALLPEGVVSTLNDFTISTWVKMDAYNWWMRVFDFGSGTDTNMFLTVQADITNEVPHLRYAIKNNGGDEQRVSYPFALPLGTWVHLAVTQAGNTASLYVNGTMVASNDAVTIKPSNLGNTYQNYLGKAQWPDPLLQGSIDEFKIFNTALNAQSIAALASNMVLSSRKDIDKDVAVYPNPATSVINITGLDAKTYQYQIYNLVGSKVAAGTLLQGQLFLPANLASGNYILQVTDNDKTDIRKRIVVRN